MSDQDNLEAEVAKLIAEAHSPADRVVRVTAWARELVAAAQVAGMRAAHNALKGNCEMGCADSIAAAIAAREKGEE